MILTEIIKSTVTNTCPRCHHGKVFENANPYSFENGLSMKETCTECHLKYEREVGFFYGAMYVSYALMSGILIVWFITDLIWLHLDPLKLASLVVGSMLVLFPVVYRWARIIWLNFFFRFDQNYLKQKSIDEKFNIKNEYHENAAQY